MTKRTEAVSIAASVLGLAVIAVALAMAFHPSVATGFAGVVLTLGGVGWQTLRNVATLGAAGPGEVVRQEQELPPE